LSISFENQLYYCPSSKSRVVMFDLSLGFPGSIR
jgi:hypothetical protein